MKRTLITVDENGELSIPSNLQDLWMSEGELVDMLHVTAPKLNSVIRVLYKEGILSMSEVQQRQETSKGIWQMLYGFPMVVAICFRLTSNGAAQLRNIILKRLYGAKEKTTISYNSTEDGILLAENGRIFDASLIYCRIDVLIHCCIEMQL